jgi:hypothetical protein
MSGTAHELTPYIARVLYGNYPSCSGPTTRTRGLTKHGQNGTRFSGNQWPLRPTFSANRPTVVGNGPQTAAWVHIGGQCSNRLVNQQLVFSCCGVTALGPKCSRILGAIRVQSTAFHSNWRIDSVALFMHRDVSPCPLHGGGTFPLDAERLRSAIKGKGSIALKQVSHCSFEKGQLEEKK